MLPSDVIVVLAKATLLFLSGFACLRLTKRSTAALRHSICLVVIGGSLAVLLTIFFPAPVAAFRLPPIAEPSLAGVVKAGGWPLIEFAAAIWICGFGAVLLRFLIGYISLARLRRSAVPLEAAGLFAADVNVPLVTGLFRPVILMPRTAVDWSPTRRTAAIRHELAHIERNDLRANFLCVLACAIYWFHPLIWLLVRRLRAEQEAACDDAVLQSGFDRADYAEALVETARRATGYSLVTCPMTDRTGVKARVTHILSREATPAGRRISQGVFAGLALVLAAVSAVGAERIYRVGASVTQPGVVRQVRPNYTPSAMEAKIQGRVRLALVIGPDGLARNIEIVQGLDSGLDRSAVQSLAGWRFRPAMHNGRPVAVRARIDVNFRLR